MVVFYSCNELLGAIVLPIHADLPPWNHSCPARRCSGGKQVRIYGIIVVSSVLCLIITMRTV